MATLFFAVFEGAAEVATGDPIQESTVNIAGSSTPSTDAILGTGRSRQRMRVRVFADVACFVTWGLSPTAQSDGTDGRPLAAEGAEYFDVEAGYKLAVILRS